MSIKTEKGKQTAMCNGFLMLLEKKSKDGLRQYWRCGDYWNGCGGRAISAVGSTVLRESVAHSLHTASPAEVKKRQVLTSVRDRAKQSHTSNSQEILNAAKSQLSEEEIATFPRDENVKMIVTNARKPGKEYIVYVEKTYIRNVAEDGTVGLPLYPPSSWNCYNSVILGLPRTNNAMEGWHRVFNRRFSKRHLGLSHFIIKIKQEEDATWKLAIRHAANPADPLRQKKSTKVENNERQISKLVRDYDAVEGELRQKIPFLKAVQHHLAKFYQPERDGEEEPAVEQPAVEHPAVEQTAVNQMNEEQFEEWLYNGH